MLVFLPELHSDKEVKKYNFSEAVAYLFCNLVDTKLSYLCNGRVVSHENLQVYLF